MNQQTNKDLHSPKQQNAWKVACICIGKFLLTIFNGTVRFLGLLVFFIILIIVIAVSFSSKRSYHYFEKHITRSDHVAVLPIHGVIPDSTKWSAYTLKKLDRLFNNKRVKAIVLDLDSPGGSAYSSFLVADKIAYLKTQHPHKKIYGMIGNVCASGCYAIAAATHEIMAHRVSTVGSIGVLLGGGLNFNRFLAKYDIDYNQVKSGKYKDVLNPLAPMNAEFESLKQKQSDNLHRYFIDLVVQNRPTLTENHLDLFSGLFWVGQENIDMGLVDKFITYDQLIKRIKSNFPNEDLEVQHYEKKQKWFENFEEWTSRFSGKLLDRIISRLSSEHT